MNYDDGKRLYATFSEAQREADRLRQKHHQGFEPYRVGASWAVGGVHMKKTKKVKSFDELHDLFDDFRGGDSDTSVDDYIAEIQRESSISESTEVGADQNWVLREVRIMRGCDIGMSQSNLKEYLVLEVEQSSKVQRIKMGGKFSVHIPLVHKQCLTLLNKNIRWHTWNNKSGTSGWKESEWFYLVEEDKKNVG